MDEVPNKIYLEVDLARELLNLVIGESIDGYQLVALEDHGKVGRWTIGGALIIRDLFTGALYRSFYQEGATEIQDEQPWDWDDKVEFHRVDPVSVQTIKYVPVTD